MDSASQPQLVYFISGMWCASCAKGVREAASEIEGVREADINYASKILVIDLVPAASAQSLDEQIQAKINRIGFGIKRQSEGWILNFREELESEMSRGLSWPFIAIVWFLAMWSSMLAFTKYAGGDLSETEAFYLTCASSAFGLPAILIGIRPYAIAGLRALRFNHRVSLDLFIFLGGLSAIAVSLLSLFSSHAVSYADSGSMIIAILLLTKKIETTVIKKITVSILAQLSGGPASVLVFKGDSWKPANLSQVRRGDRLQVLARQTIAFDGNLTSESAKINAHLLSGESTALDLRKGDDLLAGTIALTDIEMTVNQPLGFRKIDSWAEAALAGKTRDSYYSRLFAKIETGLTTAAFTGAGFLALLAWWKGLSPGLIAESFFVGILIFCPCLFASIIPLAKQIAHLALLRIGITLFRSEALLDLCHAKKFYFDKTGTLEAVRSKFQSFAEVDAVTPYLHDLSSRSSHPILRGLEIGQAKGHFKTFEETAGQGAFAITESGDSFLIGQAGFLKRHGVDIDPEWDRDFPAVAINGKIVGQLLVKKFYDRKSKSLLKRLLRIVPQAQIQILSGDPSIEKSREWQNLDSRISYKGALSPEDKAIAMGTNSVFIGDGLNDTLALAKADVGFRLGPRAVGFAPVDFQLKVPNLDLVLTSIRYAQKYRRVLWQTSLAALLYNFVAITLAAFGKFSPLGAVLAMLCSFSILLLSSLRLLNVPEENL